MKSALICSVAMAATCRRFEPRCLGVDKVPIISLDLARRRPRGCEAKAKEMNWKMNISRRRQRRQPDFLRKNGWRLPW